MLAMTLGLVIQSTPINVESPGIRLVNLIPKLAAEARLALSVVPALENDVVAIRTMGRPWGEVKSNLAKVLNATWEEKDGRFVLTQTPEQQAADLAARYECMKAKIQKLKKDLEPYYAEQEWTEREFATWFSRKTKKFDSETKGAARLPEIIWRRRSDPNGRLIARFFHSLTPSQLTEHGPDWEQRVYSDLNLPLHQKLKLGTDSMLEQFHVESEMFRAFAQKYVDYFPRTSESRRSGHWTMRLTEEFDGKLSVALWLLDASGAYFDEVSEFGDYEDPSHYEGLTAKPALSKFAEERFLVTEYLLADSSEAPTSEERKAYGVALKLVHELCDALKQCETLDPLAYLGGDDWRVFSQEKRAPMISVLADAAQNLVVMPTHPKMPTGSFRSDSGGWILGMQRDPYYVRTHRVRRDQLSKLMSQLAGYPYQPTGEIQDIDKELLIKFSSWRYHLAWMPPVDQLVRNMAGYAWPSSLGVLYATLDEASKTKLLAGQPIAISRQPEEVRRAYRETLYLGERLSGLDGRLPAVAFPAIDDGMLLWAQLDREEGYYLRFPKIEDNVVAPHLNYVDFDGLTRTIFGRTADKRIEVAKATRTLLRLNLQFRRMSPDSNKMADEFYAFPRTISKHIPYDQLPQAFREKVEERAKILID
jgi:hypothetical protein